MGFAGCYRRFIHHYATLAGPLIDLLRKDAFRWTEVEQQVFDTLKNKLGGPNSSGFQSRVSHRNRCIRTGNWYFFTTGSSHFSLKLSSRMQKASAYHREMFAIAQAMSKW